MAHARIGSTEYASYRRDWGRNGREIEAYDTPPTTLWLLTEDAFVPDPEGGTKVTGSALEPVATELAKEADLSLSLAQNRYPLSLGSIVELSQAQLRANRCRR